MTDSHAPETREQNEYTGTRAEALIAAYQAVPLFDLAPSYVMTKADFNKAIIAALNHMEDANATSPSDPPVGKDSSFEELVDALLDAAEDSRSDDADCDCTTCTKYRVAREDLSRYVAKQREEYEITNPLNGEVLKCSAGTLIAELRAQVASLQSEIERLGYDGLSGYIRDFSTP